METTGADNNKSTRCIVIGCGTRSASSAVMRSVNFLACELVNERKEESSAMCVCTFGAFVQSVE